MSNQEVSSSTSTENTNVVSSVITEGVIERKEAVALLPRIHDLPSPTSFKAWTIVAKHNANAIIQAKIYSSLSDIQFFYFFEDTLISDGALTTGRRATRFANEYHSIAIMEEAERRGWVNNMGETTDLYVETSKMFEPLDDEESHE